MRYTKKNLILSGGGMPGLFGLIGALIQLKTTPDFSYENIEKVAGSSVGSILALPLALDYTPEEIKDRLYHVDFRKFKQKHLIKRMHRLFTRYATLDRNLIYVHLTGFIKDKFPLQNPEEITYRDMHDAGFKDLYVITTQMCLINDKADVREKIFSYETTPDTSVALTVYASTAAPFFFPKVRLKELEPGRYVRSSEGDLFDDGGLMNNYLIELFDKIRYVPDVDPHKFQDNVTNPHTLGLNLDVVGKMNDHPIKKQLKYNHPFKYMKALLKTTITFDKKNLNQNNLARTIEIDRNNQYFFAFNMDDKCKETLLKSGKEAVIRYFAQHKNDTEDMELGARPISPR